jgi:hypothetical protein
MWAQLDLRKTKYQDAENCKTFIIWKSTLHHNGKWSVGLTNVVVEWLTLLFRIREVPGWNLSPETGYPEAFRRFAQSLQANAGKTTSFRPQPLPPTFFPINHSRTTPSFDAIRVTEKTSLNKVQSDGLNMRGKACSTHVTHEKCGQKFSWKVWRNITLHTQAKTDNIKMDLWLVAHSCEHGNKPWGLHKNQVISWSPERLLASQRLFYRDT